MIALVVISLLMSALVLAWCRAGALEDEAHTRWLAELEARQWKQE